MATSRRYPITLGLILGGLAGHAMAEPPAAAPSNDNGLMTFKNVRVINAPPAASQQQPAAAASNMKAFIDETGELGAPTAEQARQLSNANAAATRTRTGIVANSATNSTAGDEQLIYGPGNAVGLQLTDADMVFQRVHLDADGNLIQQCATGEDEAAHALHTPAAKAPTQQESQHDR